MDFSWKNLILPYDAYQGGKYLAQHAWDRPGAPQAQQNPYLPDWTNLIGQLQQQASGTGPSMADNAFKQAMNTTQNQSLAMARGGSAGGARQAGMALGDAQNGMMGNYANARLQEQLLARQSLMGALGGRDQAWWGPNQANLSAQMNQPSNLEMVTGWMGNNLASGAQLAGKGR